MTAGSNRRFVTSPLALVIVMAVGNARALGGVPDLPDGFEPSVSASGFDHPVDLAFAADGRMFVSEQRGVVWVVQDGTTLATPFIDLSAEVNGQWDRGLLGIALDPDFLANRHVYLLYTVDPEFGKPDEDPFNGAWGRLTRYTGTEASGGNVGDPSSRLVLIGDTAATGIPVCEPSHTVGSLKFAHDGTLFVSAGDGAHFNQTDPGGIDPECFPELFPELENIGAFRAQYLDSLAGKILRIDPATGHGVPTNPHWTGSGADNRSRIWANGLRNPFRIAMRPGTGPGPGTIYVGDVGWNAYEEISVAHGGENFGWPCREGTVVQGSYSAQNPAHSGCNTIETPPNPGPLTAPISAWHHTNGNLSTPTGITGRSAVAGAFYEGTCYPPAYQGAFFYMDHTQSWIRVMQVSPADALVAVLPFGTSMENPVDMEPDPLTGDLHYVAIYAGEVRRITFTGGVPGDVDGDCFVGFPDLLLVLASWGPCVDCPADLDSNGSVGFEDLLEVLSSWTT